MASTTTTSTGTDAAAAPRAGALAVPPRPAVPPRRPVLDADALLADLTTRQHVRPHRALRAVLGDTRACPVAAERAIEWLGLDGGVAVGRLKRGEVIQLARSLHRFWRRAVASDTPANG